MQTTMKKATLLLLGLVNVIGIGLVSPVLNSFSADFPTVSMTSVAMVITMPACTLLFGLAVCTVISRKIPRKVILLTGLICVIFGGILPAFLNNFALILTARGILGFGMGLNMPLQTKYFSEYPEKERAMLFGLNNAIGSILSAGLLFVIALIAMSWRGAFLLYGLFIIIFFAVFFFIPLEDTGCEEGKLQEITTMESKSSKLPAQLVFCYIVIFFLYAQYFIVPTTIAIFLDSHQLGSVAEAGIISGLGTLAMAIASVGFPYLRSIFGRWLTTIVLIVGAVSFIFYAAPANIIVLTVAYCMISMAAALFPITVTMKITETLPKNKIVIGSALFTSVIYIGQFISPYYQKVVMSLMGNNVDAAYLLFGIVMLLLGGINGMLVGKKK